MCEYVHTLNCNYRVLLYCCPMYCCGTLVLLLVLLNCGIAVEGVGAELTMVQSVEVTCTAHSSSQFAVLRSIAYTLNMLHHGGGNLRGASFGPRERLESYIHPLVHSNSLLYTTGITINNKLSLLPVYYYTHIICSTYYD